VEAHEHALALWGFLEISHQQLYGNMSVMTPAFQAILEASRQEAEAVLAVSHRLDDLVEAFVGGYFDDKTSTEEERYAAVAWARGQMELDPEIGEHLWDFKAAQVLLENSIKTPSDFPTWQNHCVMRGNVVGTARAKTHAHRRTPMNGAS